MKTEILSIDNTTALTYAFDILTKGGLVAFPTDTVYGLGAPAFDAEAVERIYEAKGRGMGKAIPVLIGDLDDLPKVASGVNRIAQLLAEHFWPGPLTLVVPRNPNLPDVISPTPTVGVRIPDYAPTRDLFKLAGPMAVTSANLSDHPSATTAQETLAQLDGRIQLVLDGGQTPGGVPSTVVDCLGAAPLVLRQGPITLEQIVEALK
jgi:L-threonylcarbamoyladenylate synthase